LGTYLGEILIEPMRRAGNPILPKYELELEGKIVA
jgi:hypothetical protein